MRNKHAAEEYAAEEYAVKKHAVEKQAAEQRMRTSPYGVVLEIGAVCR